MKDSRVGNAHQEVDYFDFLEDQSCAASSY